MSASATTTAPDARGGAQHAVAERADVQHVLREDRQQRGRAAQQHGDEVERHRAEQRGRAQDEAHALERVGERRRVRLADQVRAPDRAPARAARAAAPSAGRDRRDDERHGRAERGAAARPPIGPAIVPNCHTDAFIAITRGSSSVVTAAASIGP